MICRIAILMLVGFFAINSNSYAQSAEELSDSARHYYDQGKFKEAISLLEKSIQLKPLAESHYRLGLCYVRVGSLNKAYEAFQHAVALDTSYVKGYHLLGEMYFDPQSDQFNINTAQEVLEKALKIDPTHVDSQFMLSQIYFTKGTIGIDSSVEKMQQYQKLAEQALLRTLELDPQIADAHLLLGQLYGIRNQRNSAVLEFQKVVRLNPQHYEAWYFLGKDYYALELFAESANALEKAQQSQDANIRQNATELLKKVHAAQPGKK